MGKEILLLSESHDSMYTSFRLHPYIQELLYVIAIIGILMATAVSSYLPCKTKAQIISVSGLFNAARTESQVYYAIHGEWPEHISRRLKAGLHGSDSDRYIIASENGAVSFTYKDGDKRIPGKTLTMRPVIQDHDPFGPVHWVCGDKGGESGWKIFGIDRTDIEDEYIPGSLR